MIKALFEDLGYLKILLLLALFSCTDKVPEKKSGMYAVHSELAESDTLRELIQPESCDTILLGDLNQDRVADTAFVFTPATIAAVDGEGNIMYEFGCVGGDCYNTISFSAQLPELRFENSVWGRVENVGDLDQDGYCELIFCPDWFTSNMGSLYLFSLKTGAWKKITQVTYRRNQDENPLKTHVVRKKRSYYLRGIRFDDEATPYEVKIKL